MVWRYGSYRRFFYSADGNESTHVPVEREQSEAKFWLDPVRLQHSRRFATVEIRYVERLIREQAQTLLRNWYEYFGNGS